MKVLTVRQPWAWAIIHGGKDVENRTWVPGGEEMHNATWGERIAIHAARKIDPKAGEIMKELGLKREWPANYDLGAIIGTVEVVSFEGGYDAVSVWAMPGYWHWVLADPQPLRIPLPFKGRLGLWEFDLEASTT